MKLNSEQNPYLTANQSARVEALKISREVLSETVGGPLNNTRKTADTIDLVSIATWIIDGKDPWRPKKRHLNTNDMKCRKIHLNKDET